MKKVILIIIAFSSVIYGFIYFGYPKNWKQIRLGDSPEIVKSKCPSVNQELHGIKGDFCVKELPFITWQLQVLYSENDVVSKALLVVFLGSKNDFIQINIKDLAI